MNREKLRLLGFFLFDVTGSHNELSTIDDGWKKTILDACTPIAYNIPEDIGDIIRERIRSRLNSQVVSQSPESSLQPEGTTNALVSRASRVTQPRNTSASPAAEAISVPTDEEVELTVESAPEDLPLETQINHFSDEDLKLWANEPEKFLNPKGFNIERLSVVSYIREVEGSQALSEVRLRFALRQLWLSSESRRPLPQQDFKEKLGCGAKEVARSTWASWKKEGRIYSLLSSKHGIGVLFSMNVTRSWIQRLSPKKRKKGSNADFNKSSAEFENVKDDEAFLSAFTTTKIGVPGEQYTEAAESIAAYLEHLHRQLGVFGDSEGTVHQLDTPSKDQNEPTSKRPRVSYGPPGHLNLQLELSSTAVSKISDNSRPSQSILGPCQPLHSTNSATDNNPMYGISQRLRESATKATTNDDRNGSPKSFDACFYRNTCTPDNQADMSVTQVHVITRDDDPGRSSSFLDGHSEQPSRQQSTPPSDSEDSSANRSTDISSTPTPVPSAPDVTELTSSQTKVYQKSIYEQQSLLPVGFNSKRGLMGCDSDRTSHSTDQTDNDSPTSLQPCIEAQKDTQYQYPLQRCWPTPNEINLCMVQPSQVCETSHQAEMGNGMETSNTVANVVSTEHPTFHPPDTELVQYTTTSLQSYRTVTHPPLVCPLEGTAVRNLVDEPGASRMNQDLVSETANNPCSLAISESFVGHPRPLIREASTGTGRAHTSIVSQDGENQQLNSDEQQGREQDAMAGIEQCNNIVNSQFGGEQDILLTDDRFFLDSRNLGLSLLQTDLIFVDEEFFEF